MKRLLAIGLLLCLCLTATTISGGKKTVTTSGTAVALAASATTAVWVTVQALPGNTGGIWVGGPDILATSKNGTYLTAGQAAPLSAIPGFIFYDLSTIWIDASVSGEGVSYTYAH